MLLGILPRMMGVNKKRQQEDVAMKPVRTLAEAPGRCKEKEKAVGRYQRESMSSRMGFTFSVEELPLLLVVCMDLLPMWMKVQLTTAKAQAWAVPMLEKVGSGLIMLVSE